MKILVIGNETEDTDFQTSRLANIHKIINQGLISSIENFSPNIGFYHTSVVDLSPGDIIQISKKFDKVILLDQDIKTYPYFKSFVTTLRLMYDLESLNFKVDFRNNKSAQNFIYWKEYLQTNKAFCFYPFVALVDDTEYTSICPKNRHVQIKKSENIINWQTDKDYSTIRNDMASGKLNPTLCNECYRSESHGEESTRQYETLEWTQRINVKEPADFFKITSPKYYEIRPSNKCNIMCRTCDDHHSHLIEKEWRTIGIPLYSENFKLKTTNFNNINFETLEKIYVGGGEPTIIPEFYDFLRKCIELKNTNFDLYIGTNGMKISDTLLNLLDNFKHVCFSFSFDGYGVVNDYIRWGSQFDVIVENSRKVRSRGHTVALQTVFSMYSITRMHEVFKFYDQEYPTSGLLVQLALGQGDIFLPLNHPYPELVVKSMQLCQQTNTYFQNGRSIKSMVDLLLKHYTDPTYKCDLTLLEKFYKFNDKLDKSRNSKLFDYIPELDQGRTLL